MEEIKFICEPFNEFIINSAICACMYISPDFTSVGKVLTITLPPLE